MFVIQIKYTTYGRRAQTSYLNTEESEGRLACKYRASRYNSLQEAEVATCYAQDVSVPYGEYLVEIVEL